MKKYNYNYAILRYFNIAGASSSNKIGEINSSHGHLFKNIAIQSLKKNPVINVYGDNYKTKSINKKIRKLALAQTISKKKYLLMFKNCV